MAKFLFLCFLLANAILCLAMDTNNQPQIMFQSISSPSSNPPAQSPSSNSPSIARKIGKHYQHKKVSFSVAPSPSPSSEAPQSEKKLHSSSTEGSSIPSNQRTSVEEVLGSHEQVHLLKQHHHSFDKSIAGGGVILGGLATTFLVSVFCYIRATARHKSETNA